ncbi:hypothetical protein [Nocardia xishanensis]
MSAPLVFLDTETDGLHPGRRPWEIAMIRRDGDAERAITIYVAGVDLSAAELIGLNIGGFHQRHPEYRDWTIESEERYDPWASAGAVKPGERLLVEGEAARLVELWTRGAHIVGAVPSFDVECLGAMLRRNGVCPSWHYHPIDVEALAVGWLHGQRAARIADGTGIADEPLPQIALPWRSDDLSRVCGVEPPSEEERHTAMGDARWVQRWYDRITGGAA